MTKAALLQLPCDCTGPRSNWAGVDAVDVVDEGMVVDDDAVDDDVVVPEPVVDVVVVPEWEPLVVVGPVVVEPEMMELAGGGRELSPPPLVADEASTVR